MENVKINKAKIKDGLFLEGEYTEQLPGHSKNKVSFSRTVPIHQDLIDAFGKLPKHLSILTDGLTMPAKIKHLDQWDPGDLEKFTAKGFTITGTDENEGVTISGAKEGNYGIINLNTPSQKWESSEYSHISDLGSDINTCIYEVEQYLFQGKKAPEKQMEIDFEDLESEESE